MTFKTQKDMVKLADELQADKTVSQSLLSAGYSRKQALKGRRVLPAALYEELSRRGVHYIRLGNVFSPEERTQLVRGGLIANAIEGRDKSVRSLEMLGNDIAVSMFKPGARSVDVLIRVPEGFAELLCEDEGRKKG